MLTKLIRKVLVLTIGWQFAFLLLISDNQRIVNGETSFSVTASQPYECKKTQQVDKNVDVDSLNIAQRKGNSLVTLKILRIVL